MTPRPRERDQGVIEDAAKRLAPEVAKWVGHGAALDDVTADLIWLLRYGARDGYKLARDLETLGTILAYERVTPKP